MKLKQTNKTENTKNNYTMYTSALYMDNNKGKPKKDFANLFLKLLNYFCVCKNLLLLSYFYY